MLVDSEPVANRTLGQMLRELGLDLTQEEIFQNFVGYSLPHCMRVIEGMLGRPPPEGAGAGWVAHPLAPPLLSLPPPLRSVPPLPRVSEEKPPVACRLHGPVLRNPTPPHFALEEIDDPLERVKAERGGH